MIDGLICWICFGRKSITSGHFRKLIIDFAEAQDKNSAHHMSDRGDTADAVSFKVVSFGKKWESFMFC